MRRRLLITAAAALALAATALGLDGKDGYAATQLFTEDDVRSELQYPLGFSGIAWADLAGGFHVGNDTWNPEFPVIAANESGDVFLRVAGGNLDGRKYTGLIRYDGIGYFHLVQEDGHNGSGAGSRIEAVAVSPVSVGKLTAGHAVVARFVRPVGGGDFYSELVSIDHTTSPPTETLVYTSPANVWILVFAIDESGTIFHHAGGLRRLSWNGGGYSDTLLTTGIGNRVMVLGPDGAIYGFAPGTTWGVRGENELLRFDPVTGASSVHATVSSRYFFGGLAADDEGNLWMGLGNVKKGKGIITAVHAGSSVSAGDAIGEVTHYTSLRTYARGVAGELLVVEQLDHAQDNFYTAVSALTPGRRWRGRRKRQRQGQEQVAGLQMARARCTRAPIGSGALGGKSRRRPATNRRGDYAHSPGSGADRCRARRDDHRVVRKRGRGQSADDRAPRLGRRASGAGRHPAPLRGEPGPGRPACPVPGALAELHRVPDAL